MATYTKDKTERGSWRLSPKNLKKILKKHDSVQSYLNFCAENDLGLKKKKKSNA